ncbi:LuxR family transcriptional regulator [Photorhabdus luminescens subsp. luminescens]|uniref:PAS fold-containing protein n=2 Tax=Photorhabdus luminescens TaxID=29488 RepID=A0A1G5RFC4_PHOLU|nr:PAS and helix-turn-helix domain-containing protein [Photorhabdus luminescens]KMW72329.1 LuxR family transcriptional regulator [Photorhabdus luminescens subsp. luminescens]TDB51549.1 helix-turn-helix transcriptional regulator [Photorhabdus luminescens subsp. mexicana]SCZ72686.1 PAS fold-containing protein [Photorhabdus luminescens]
MEKINKLTISSQVINTMQQSNEPWAIKDKDSCWIFGNLAFRQIQDLPDLFDYEGKYDNELPWNGAEFAKDFVIHDKSVMKQGQRICSLETHTYGKDTFPSSYFSEKYPLYNDENECTGIFLHAWKAKDYSLASLHLYYKTLPASIILQPPSDIFTPREWDIIFFFLQKYTRKQIGQKLNIAYHTVETYMARIYGKIGIHSSQQLEEYCLANNFHHYVPEKFLLS